MKLKDIQNIFHQDLDLIYGKEEVNSFFFMLLEHYYKFSRIQLALDPDFSITKAEQDLVFNALHLLKEEKPIQYILGETEFFGLPFKVNEHTLIPRPETEELVDLVIQNIKNKKEDSKTYSILDIGTGTGCIAISLAKQLPNANVYAVDVSSEALKMARQNAKLNQVEVTFVKTDILKKNSWDSEFKNLKFDVIVSNPPYVRDLEKAEMTANVLQNEPHLALFVDDDNPLQFYKAITEFSINRLKDKGMLYFEINEYLGKEMIQLLEDNNFSDIELKQDFFKKDRMIKGVKI